MALLQNPLFTEKELLVLLNRQNLPSLVVEEIAQNRTWIGLYPVKRALVRHPKTPVRTSLDLLKFLFLFDLVSVSLVPAIPHEVKELAENLILLQLPKLPLGQKITLARRASLRIATELLKSEIRMVYEAALDNPRINEAAIIQALNRPGLDTPFVDACAKHRKWSFSYGVRLALLRTNLLSMANFLKFSVEMRLADLQEIAEDPKVNQQVRVYLLRTLSTSRRV